MGAIFIFLGSFAIGYLIGYFMVKAMFPSPAPKRYDPFHPNRGGMYRIKGGDYLKNFRGDKNE